MPHLPTIHLYRYSLRVVRKFPIKNYHGKLKYNVRDLIENYRFETKQLNELINNGYSDLKIVQAVGNFDRATLDKLFKQQ